MQSVKNFGHKCIDSAHTIVSKIGRQVYNWPNIIFSPSSDNGPLAF